MVKARAVFRQPRFVKRRAIALVQLETVARVFLPERDHHAVAGHFGDDRGRRDRRRQRVAIDGTALRIAQIEHAGVDDERVDVDIELKTARSMAIRLAGPRPTASISAPGRRRPRWRPRSARSCRAARHVAPATAVSSPARPPMPPSAGVAPTPPMRGRRRPPRREDPPSRRVRPRPRRRRDATRRSRMRAPSGDREPRRTSQTTGSTGHSQRSSIRRSTSAADSTTQWSKTN